MASSELPEKLQYQIIKEKHLLIPQIMQKNQIDCWIVFVRETMITKDPIFDLIVGGEAVWESAFIFATSQRLFRKIAIVGNFDVAAFKEKSIWSEVIGYTEGISKPLREVIDDLNPQTIALNFSINDVIADGLTYGMFLKIKKILNHLQEKFCSAAPLIQSLKGIKSKTEIQLILEACKLTEKINQNITSQLKANLSESEIQNLFYHEMERYNVKNAWQKSSCPSIDAGPDKQIGHIGPSSDNFVKHGHTLHNDFGVKLTGYCSDLQRMWFFGTPSELPLELRHGFDTVYNAISLAAEKMKPGVAGYLIDQIVREYVISQGYAEFPHALGHQVGINAHDGGTILGPLWERYGNTPYGLIEKGNIFTLELHVKTRNYGYISLEEMVVVDENSVKFLVPRQTDYIYINSH